MAAGAGNLRQTPAGCRCYRTGIHYGDCSAAPKAWAVLCISAVVSDAACEAGRGAKGLGLSLLKLQRGVSFGADEFDPVDIIIMLAAPDKHSHIEMISALAELFSSDVDMEKLHQAKTRRTLKRLLTVLILFHFLAVNNITPVRDADQLYF